MARLPDAVRAARTLSLAILLALAPPSALAQAVKAKKAATRAAAAPVAPTSTAPVEPRIALLPLAASGLSEESARLVAEAIRSGVERAIAGSSWRLADRSAGAALVVAGEVVRGRKGFACTLLLQDPRSAGVVANEQVEAASAAELLEKLDEAGRRLVEPRVRAVARPIDAPPGPATATPTHPVERSRGPLAGRAAEVYAARKVELCGEGATWWFCSGAGEKVTENGFVERYRDLTGRRDLDFAEGADNLGTRIGGMACLAVGTALLVHYFPPYVDQVKAARRNEADSSKTTALVFGVTGGILGVAVGGTLAVLGFSSDGRNETDHRMTYAQGSEGARRYNDALRDEVERAWSPRGDARPPAPAGLRLVLGPTYLGLAGSF